MLTIRFDELGLRPGDSVLDVGAGFGRHVFECARRGANVVALDYAENEVVQTRATLGGMVDAGEIPIERFKGVLRGDATRLPFADDSFDVVITSEVLEHIQNDVAAIAEMVRVLKPGGTFAGTVPAWFPEKINWMLSDEYHAPIAEGGHVRIYSATELAAKLRAAGLDLRGHHRAHALHSPYWWLKCAVGPRNDEHPLVVKYREFLEWDIMKQPTSTRIADRVLSPAIGKSIVFYGVKHPVDRVNELPELDGVVSADEVHRTAAHLASLQLSSGMIPWFEGGHCDPWNHVESAMALDVAGHHAEAERAYEWLVDTQLPLGGWYAYYGNDGSTEDDKIDTNVCAYIAAGAYHHYRSTWNRGFAEALWPTVERALEFVLSMRRSDGVPLWAVEIDAQPWDYALLTGTASIQHSLRCGAALGTVLGSPRPAWIAAADCMTEVIRTDLSAFEPKTRWAMDWYYPVLTGALVGEEAKARLAEGWDTFAMEGLGIRCVSDEPWVTASETAECALAFATIGDLSTATDLLRWTRHHRRPDGAYWTGVVHPSGELFPPDEHTSYTSAAVLLAVDGITQTTQASDLFAPQHD